MLRRFKLPQAVLLALCAGQDGYLDMLMRNCGLACAYMCTELVLFARPASASAAHGLLLTLSPAASYKTASTCHNVCAASHFVY